MPAGLTWDSFDVDRISQADAEHARQRFLARFPEMIWNTAALEGNNFSLNGVQALLVGKTVGRGTPDDERQVVALIEAYGRLDEMVGNGEFALSKAVSDEINGLVARYEAIEAGHFRGEGRVTGGGTVRLACGGSVPGTEHGPGGATLRAHYDDLLGYLSTVSDARRRALIYFASATRWQLYFDGNKRTARLMMAGELMSHGYAR